MAPEKKPAAAREREAPEEQDKSIKERKSSLFEVKKAPTHITRPFSEYVREAPADPLSPGVKATLGVLGGVIALLFLAALLSSSRSKPARKPRADVARPAQAAAFRPIA
jgi:hypothetical protein